MAVDVGAIVAIIIFYLIILLIGLWAGRKAGSKTKNLRINDVMLANRSINLAIGFFTLTATWVGGGFINGTAEIIVSYGLIWCQSPVGFAVSGIMSGYFFVEKMRTSRFTTMLDPFHWKFGRIINCLLYIPAVTGDIFWSGAILAALAGYFFVEKMRTSRFTTMLDPFHWKFGRIINCLLYIPAVTGDIFWSGAILAALGSTLKVVLDIDLELAIIISAAISVVYTLFGGLYSVAYTDIIQLILVFVGLWFCVPFIMTHDSTGSISKDSEDVWFGTLENRYIANYIDIWLLTIFGGMPWQELWQRDLAAKNVRTGQLLHYFAALASLVMAMPSVLIGAAAASTNWTTTDYGHPAITFDDAPLTLPLALKHLCPTAVGVIGLGALSAAVMSSTDSAFLAASSMFSRNVFGVIYAEINKKRPSEAMQVWIMRGAQIVIAAISCVMAIEVNSVYDLLLLSTDLIYVSTFPQLVCVLYMKKANAYGSFVAFFSGLTLRLLSGEPGLDFEPVIEFPWYDGLNKAQLFPFRTFCMLVSFFSLIFVSLVTDYLFRNEIIPLRYDFYSCFQHLSKDRDVNGKRPAVDSISKGWPDSNYAGSPTTSETHLDLNTRF